MVTTRSLTKFRNIEKTCEQKRILVTRNTECFFLAPLKDGWPWSLPKMSDLIPKLILKSSGKSYARRQIFSGAYLTNWLRVLSAWMWSQKSRQIACLYGLE